jgi:hypothetical protein
MLDKAPLSKQLQIPPILLLVVMKVKVPDKQQGFKPTHLCNHHNGTCQVGHQQGCIRITELSFEGPIPEPTALTFGVVLLLDETEIEPESVAEDPSEMGSQASQPCHSLLFL